MKRVAFILVTLVILLTAVSASAAVGISYKDYPTADGNDPTVKTCVAYSAYRQKCRECRVNSWNPDGTAASLTCVGVTTNMFCVCDGCRPKGLCTYH